jgi:hypothetical protein
VRTALPDDAGDGGNVNAASLAGVRVTCARGRITVDASDARPVAGFTLEAILAATMHASRANAVRCGGAIVELRGL